MKYFLFLFSVLLISFTLATSTNVDINGPVVPSGGGGEVVIEPPEINIENETEPITFSKMDTKCITGCVRDILDNTFIITNEDVSGDAYMIIDMLKGMNYGLAEELDTCQEKLDKANINKYITIFSVIIALLLIIWKTFDVANSKKK